MIQYIFRITSLGVLLAAFGCGNANKNATTTTVTGKVTLPGGAPLPGGRIDFHSVAEPNKLGSGLIKDDGSYEAANVPIGECTVTVENLQLRRAGHAVGAESMAGNHDMGQKYIPINAKYAKPQSSGLIANVDGNSCTYNVEVK